MIHRRGSVYLAVVGTISAVTVLTLTGVALRKGLHARARVGTETDASRILARSGAELVLDSAINHPSDFVAAVAKGAVLDGVTVPDGTVSAACVDADTGTAITDETESIRVIVSAAVGDATSRLGFAVTSKEDPLTTLVKKFGAISYWPLDEKTGSTRAIDVIAGHDGAYNDSTAPGAEAHVHGNKAPAIDDTGDRVVVAHHSDFEESDGTIACWVYFDAIPSSGRYETVISKENTSSSKQGYFSLYLSYDGTLNTAIQSNRGGGIATAASGIIKPKTWHHVAVTFGNGLLLYIDGTLVAKNATNNYGLDSSGGTDPNTQPWFFGASNQSGLLSWPINATKGSVARVALFDDILTETDIGELHKTSSATQELELIPGSFVRVFEE